MIKVKVCGITQQEQLEQLSLMGVDYIGNIFYDGSKRYVTQILNPVAVNTVGVFVDADFETIQTELKKNNAIKTLQLHGVETPEFCAALKDYFTIIKAIPVDEETDIDAICTPYINSCHYFLFDTKTPQHGGSGVQFDWKKLTNYNLTTPFFLSGGIGIRDIDAIKNIKHPQLFGVDINSAFESSPGIKDLDLIKTFVNQLRNN